MAPPDWAIERLAKRHDRASFSCGQPTLDDWLKHRATQYVKRDLTRVYVATRTGESVVLGYHAMSNHRVSYESLPTEQAKGLPQIDIPVILLGRLAIDRSVQGQGLGELLLLDALRRAHDVANHIGVRAVEVDAINEGARSFYAKYGFVQLTDDPNHLFLPMQVIRKLNLPR